MKKVIKNYLTKLQENDKKGFSLVELIIVMAIMAILVGIVASQVLPYMEKSRMSKDQQQLSSLCTDMVSAIAQSSSAVSSFSASELNTFAASGNDWVTQLGLLRSADGTSAETLSNIESAIVSKFNSKKAKAAGRVYVAYDASTGIVTVYADSSIDKLKVTSE
jgi:prepilin-type N-terminal cleavage/methylation domain-containing protein